MALIANRYLRKCKTGTKVIQLERLGLDENDYKAIEMADDESEQAVVPLEEAILINDQETRRKLIIDVLQQDPSQYIHLLQKACENEDIEVTHYATTAIMEIQREYEMQIKSKEEAYEAENKDIEAIEAYIFSIRDYIKSGLMQASLLYMQRQRYDVILTKRLEMKDPSVDFYIEAINNLLEMEIFEKAHKLIDGALYKWPKSEELLMIKLKYYHLTENGPMIRQTIEDIKTLGPYISPNVQEKIAFWSK